MVALPCFLKVKKRIPKPLSVFYPEKLVTIGDHLRKTRLDRKMLQKELGKVLGVTNITIKNWEKNHKKPMDSYLPDICDFLGFCPLLEKAPEHFGHRLNLFRRYNLGLSLEACASLVGIDPFTLSEIENDNIIRFKKVETKVSLFAKDYSLFTIDDRFRPVRLLRPDWV